MSILKEFELEISEKDIIRLLGYKDSLPDEETMELIRSEANRCSGYLTPEIVYEKIYIKEKKDNQVFLNNNVILEGEFIKEKLAECQYVIVVVSTIGKGIEELINEKYEVGDYLSALIIDNVGTIALDHINRFFWNRMVESLKGSSIGITSRLSPGDTAMSVEEQTKIFKCLEGNEINVKLTDSYMMLPLKATSAIYGFGEGIGITRIEHVCRECSLKNCSYRMRSKINVIVNYEDKKISLTADEGSNLLEVLRNGGILIQSPCGGKRSCGKCRVKVIKGLEENQIFNNRHLSREEYDMGIRLACDIELSTDIEIKILAGFEEMEIMSGGVEKLIALSPKVSKKHLTPGRPCIGDQRDDYKRIRDEIGTFDLVISYDMLQHISRDLRNFNFDFTTVLYNKELIGIEKGDTSGISYGIAIDIGTTTIAGYLINLIDGKTLEVESRINKQAVYGADVISRINFTIENENGTRLLRESITSQINDIIQLLCENADINPQYVYNAVVAGNTTMIHLLLGLQTENIALAPYIPVLTAGMDFKAKELGININGVISIMPGISGYVGSDITAGIVSSGMMESDKYSILLDLGTNGEIALGNRNEIITCSTAAGPAFEGANIKCGIGGIKGAINRINLNDRIVYETIGGIKASGICGSGVLDIVSEFIKHGVIDDTGRMLGRDELGDADLSKRLTFSGNVKEFIIEETDEFNKIVFTQKDVREVQLAKAAISAGIKILLKELKLGFNDIDKVYIGGGFGNFMDIGSAVNIGLLPKELESRIISIGNCAGTGAKQYLLSDNKRLETENIIRKAAYIELSDRKDFQDFYIDSMMFSI